jgi:hypothetical protein
MTPRLSQSLPRRAVAVGVDGRSRFAKDRYEVTGFALGSHVVGSAEALHALRPRGTAASDHLTGAEAQARLARVEGAFLWSVATRLVTPDFETNDAGFQRNADWALAVGSWRFQDYRPGHAVRRWAVGSTQLGYGRTLGGLTRAATVDLRADADLANYWGGSVEFLRELPSYDPEVLRGGPFLRLPTRDHLEVAAYTDTRKPWQVTANGAYVRERGSSTSGWSLAARASGFLSDRLQVSLAPTFSTAHEGWQFVAATRDAGGRGRWILGNMRQRTASLTTRATWAFSPHLTLQLYADAFVSSGAFGAFSEVPADQVSSTARRVRPIVPDRLRRDGAIWRLDGGERATSFADPAYSERDLNMNLLLRWEFRPGSTLYAVWTQARRDDVARPFDLGTDLARLQNARGRNALELKVSWWLAT